MLAAQFAPLAHPVLEETAAGRHDFEPLERNVLEAFGFVVAVEGLQLPVEQFRKLRQVGRSFHKLDDPLVAAVSFIVHIHGRGGVLQHFGSRLAAGEGQPLFGIVHNEFLAEGVDELFRTAGNHEFVRILRGETHGVADDVAPQSAAGGDHHRVILSRLDAPERDDGRIGLSELIHRDEFVEDAVVERQAQRRVGRIVLQAEEAFAGVVGLHVVHLR